MKPIRDDVTARIEGVRPSSLRDDEAPTSPSHETPSSLWRRGMDVGLNLAARGKSVSWAVVAFTAVLGATAVAWRYVSAEVDCSPLVVQYVLHLSTVGGIEAEKLDAAGEHVAAESIRALTDVNRVPDDVRLCLILDERKRS